jgi:hypothetical protein
MAFAHHNLRTAVDAQHLLRPSSCSKLFRCNLCHMHEWNVECGMWNVECADALCVGLAHPCLAIRLVGAHSLACCTPGFTAHAHACCRHTGSQVIFVGDLVNKGPKSKRCLEIAINEGALCVRGNHEQAVLAALAKRRADGPNSLKKAEYAWTDALSDEEVRARKRTSAFSLQHSLLDRSRLSSTWLSSEMSSDASMHSRTLPLNTSQSPEPPETVHYHYHHLCH